MSTYRRPPPDDIGVHESAAGASSDGLGNAQRRFLLRLGAILLALALIAAAIALGTRVPPTQLTAATATATPTGSFLPLAGLSCINDAAWAPTSDLLALVGPTGPGCARGTGTVNEINIYRAQSLSLVRHILPDDAIYMALVALGLASPAAVTPVPGANGVILTYVTLRWSPAGTQLAVSFTFDVLGGGSFGTGLGGDGLVLVNADGSHERVLIDNQRNPVPVYTIWDLQAGTVVATSANTTFPDAPYSNLPPAQSYTWAANGNLELGLPIGTGSTAEPAGLVGNPIGFSSFGPWQPGSITVVLVPASGQAPVSYLDLYATTFAAWSPDGRYFADGLSVRGLLRPDAVPLPPPSILSPLQLEHVAKMPIRDAGLSAVQAHDLPQPTSQAASSANEVPIAWRPDGKMLAVLNQHNGFLLRATDTGQVVKNVPLMELPPGQPALLPGFPGTFDTPLWSPDGKWLLLPTAALLDMSQLGV